MPPQLRRYRDELAGHMIREARRQQGEAISFAFEAGVSAVDLDGQTVTVSHALGGADKARTARAFAQGTCRCTACVGLGREQPGR